jgi:hypothetical protein
MATEAVRTVQPSEHGIVLADGAVRATEGGVRVSSQGRIALDAGLLLARADGLLSVLAPGVEVTGFGGVFTVRADADVVAVQAITSPVLVRIGAEVVLVPAASTWSVPDASLTPWADEDLAPWWYDRRPLPLPERTLREVLREAGSLPAATPPTTTVSTLTPFDVAVELPAATERRRLERVLMTLEQLPALAETDLPSAVASLESFTIDDLALAAARAALARALVRIADEPQLRLVLLPAFLREDSDASALLTAFHPALRDVSWGMPTEVALSVPVRTLRLLNLPASDRLGRALSSTTRAAWLAELSALATDQPQVAFTSVMGEALADGVASLIVDGFTLRAEAWAGR